AYALEVAARPRPIINEIAHESLSLLYPSPDELKIRIPQPPTSDETLLIVTDARLARECFTADCPPSELFIPRTFMEETILRFYGPEATGQIQPENISTITFAELKTALSGVIVSAPDPSTEEEIVTNESVSLSAEEVRQRIQAADWLIFAALDLNTSRFNSSDALKLFLSSQEGGALRDRKTVVFAFNAPYYLDTTEVTKLTAYYGVYSKTQPHIEAAVRALFGETPLLGASPVSVEGIGYELADVLAPHPDQLLPLEQLAASPDSGIVPVSVQIRVGPIFDHNNRLVPDDTPIEINAKQGETVIVSEIINTQNGLAEGTLTLTEAGAVSISANAGPNIISEAIDLTILAQPTPTQEATVSPTPTEPPTATPSPSPTSPPTPTATLTPTSTPEPTIDTPKSSIEQTPPLQPRALDGVDLLSALSATFLVGLLGFWLGQQQPAPLSQRVRVGLWVLIGGLLAYLLYGVGWLRPEQWLIAQPDVLVERLTVAGLAFLFGVIALIIAR
ncbi:MAG: hypothetical protein AAF485_33270, partial [Chloroflexota bacterium]